MLNLPPTPNEIRQRSLAKTPVSMEVELVSPTDNLLTEEGVTFAEHDSSKTSIFSFFSDIKSIILLLTLYTIQGIPMGLSASIPFLLQGHVSYNQLGVFSLVSLPFSLKVIWAPLVDSLHFPYLGRRKSWLLPVQMCCSATMLLGSLSNGVDYWIGLDYGNGTGRNVDPNVVALLLYFGLLYILMATQDIVVDGWSLTLLQEENRPLSSICNAIGQTLGFSISHFGFLALQDANTANRWFRRTPLDTPIVTLGSFLRFWSIVVFIATVVSLFFPENSKSRTKQLYNALNTEEKDEAIKDLLVNNEQHRVITKHLSIGETYYFLFKTLTISPVLILSGVLLTCRFAFGPVDGVVHLKLIEAGIRKEELALFAPFLIPFSILSPMLIGRMCCGPTPLRWFMYGWIFRWLMSFVWLGIIYMTKFLYADRDPESSIDVYYYIILFIVSVLHSSASDVMFASQMAFFAKVSDPAIGGTYMTLLNTITNVGNKWPSTLSLFMIEKFSFRNTDGFYVQTVVFSILGLIWFKVCQPIVSLLQKKEASSWIIVKKNTPGIG